MSLMDKLPIKPLDLKRKRRPFRRLHDQAKARSDDVYSGDEIVRLYSVDDQTVRNWCKEGLKRVGGTSRFLVRGDELNAFHAARNTRARQPMTLTEFLCLTCHFPREPSPGSVVSAQTGKPDLRLEACCSVCGKAMYRAWSLAAATALQARPDLWPNQVTLPTTRPTTLFSQPPELQRIATACDSVSPDETCLPRESSRTPEKPADTNESRQLSLLFGF